jgi:uncharacterized protein YxjI
MNEFHNQLANTKLLHIQQMYEAFELLGFETRNKYRILDESKNQVAFAAEESTGISGAVIRHFLGHWRSFRVTIFDQNKNPLYKLHFPFRWFFKTLFVSHSSGQQIGKLEQRFAIFRKKFDVYDEKGQLLARINSSFFRFWTFEFFHRGQSLGKIQKKWSGGLTELFTDKDNFVLTFSPLAQSSEARALMLATCIMVDIIYFENNKTDVTDLFS